MILNEIVSRKRADLAQFPKIKTPLPQSRENFLAAISAPGLQVVAEVKAKSPSTGVLCEDYQPAKIAAEYLQGGAAAISVLTDSPFFGGKMQDIAEVKAATGLPVLCKDFVIDEKQIEQARFHGADAVLLIARILDLNTLACLKAKIEHLNMLALIEIFDENDLQKALLVNPQVLMINHRDLNTLQVDCTRSQRFVQEIPASILIIAASGITTPEQSAQLDPRIKAVLIGTHLLRSDNPAQFICDIRRLTCA